MPKISVKGVSEKDYNQAGSKFITLPTPEVGAAATLAIECGMPDWDTPGQSIKFPVKVIQEGVDQGKEDKISCGIKKDAIWKLKEVVAGFGKPDAVSFDEDGVLQLDADVFPGIKAYGIWIGTKSNTDPPFIFAKLQSISLQAGSSETLL